VSKNTHSNIVNFYFQQNNAQFVKPHNRDVGASGCLAATPSGLAAMLLIA